MPLTTPHGRRPGGSASAPPVVAVFDVCHTGVALRTLLFVHGVLLLVLLPAAESLTAWLMQASLLCAVALPATLLWLGLLCASQSASRRLARRLGAVPWILALALGAACAGLAALAWRVWVDHIGGEPVGPLQMPGALLAGAAFAAVVVHWMSQRARMQASPATQARLAELQSRIRPHFLFNALNSAIALVEVHPEQAEQVLEDLAELFRAALDERGSQVALADELALARRYLAIEQIRFGTRLTVRWSVDPAAAHARVPPLVLQPLVENAVRHGVERDAGPGLIEVFVRVEPSLTAPRAVIEMTNAVPTSAPMASDRAGPTGFGIALANVRERLALMHDVALRFTAGPDGAGRWRVRIELPLDPLGEDRR